MGHRRLICAHIWAAEGLYGPIYGPKKAYMSPRRLMPQKAYMGPRRLTWAHIWAPEGLCVYVYGHQKAYMGPYMGPIHKALIRLQKSLNKA